MGKEWEGKGSQQDDAYCIESRSMFMPRFRWPLDSNANFFWKHFYNNAPLAVVRQADGALKGLEQGWGR